ncbi:unnamed protein product [Adineta steineri]|uniref:Uncharacterized protein n=1 Tax=Adineta steineri TaxID=433720 RepID=A0A815KXJ0_9BILA|nr:unnamed protein product [Adineta steineri]CAF1395683.1 unnamed protein product [Adineta steineri]
MIDPRFANAGAVPLNSGYGVPSGSVHHHHRHRHHRQRKPRQGGIGESPLSRDESIHKVDHGHPFQPQESAQHGNGFGVPYGASGIGVGGGSYYQQQPQQQQQQQYGGSSGGGGYGFGHQHQSNGYGQQGQYGGNSGASMMRHHRRRHRYHGETMHSNADQSQGIPEQLIGQRSSSVLGNEAPQVRSPIPSGGDSDARVEQVTHSRRRHHRNHSTEHAGYAQAHQSRSSQGRTTAGPDGYGHINDDLIFIERGDHSPHRQEPPPGYEYKGKIEVQGLDKETRSRSQGHSSGLSPQPASAPLPLTMTNPCAGLSTMGTMGGCPPGWQQMILTAAPGGPCPPGATMYTGQIISSGGMPQPGLGGMGGLTNTSGGMGYGGVGPIGATGSGGGLANLAASLPIPPQGQLVADYIVEAGASDIGGSSGGGYSSSYQQASGCGGAAGGASYGEQEIEANTSSRATIIEVWQKRSKSEGPGKSRSRSPSGSRSPKSGSQFDFERFRNEILAAIERMAQTGGSGAKIQWTGHDGGTQTQINPTTGFDDKRETERRPTSSSAGEVRVIVQPIQPVFYMPRQGETASTTGVSTGPSIQQTNTGPPNVVYIPRNVYVPVIKPVFVPRERVIVRPQVIHVARPVLVDRPVPVTQRPIIIDRERPVPVPLRNGGGGGNNVNQEVETKTVKEEYVYRDNLPVAYGGRCADFTGGTNYGYTPTQQEQQQYTTDTAHEMTSNYNTQGTTIPDHFQHSQSAAQLNLQQGGGGGGNNYQESYSNLARTSSASAVDAGPLSCTAPIEVLDATINNSWQRTDKSTLVRRYGRPAYDIVQKTDQVEQQMYQELRQRNGSGGGGGGGGGAQRPDSSNSYASGSGIGGMTTGGYTGSTGSYTQIPVAEMKNYHVDGMQHHHHHHQGQGHMPVSINY